MPIIFDEKLAAGDVGGLDGGIGLPRRPRCLQRLLTAYRRSPAQRGARCDRRDWRRRLRITLPVVLLAAVFAAQARAGGQDFYLVEDYDPRRDNMALVSAAMERAAADDKRVLLVLGGDWCGWCKVLENDIDRSEELIDLLDRHYVVAKVYCDAGSPGIRFKPRKQPEYGASFVNIRAKAYPHVVILDSDGNRLLSRDMGGLVKKGRYAESKLLRLLNRHK